VSKDLDNHHLLENMEFLADVQQLLFNIFRINGKL